MPWRSTMPLSIFGGLAAVAIGVFFARGFGVPVVAWAWPILFVGLGAGFLFVGVLAFAVGGITFVIIGVLFVVMGLVPLVARAAGGSARALPRRRPTPRAWRSSAPSDARRSFAPIPVPGLARPRATLVPTAQDWLASIVLFLVSAGAGVWLGNLLFASFGSS